MALGPYHSHNVLARQMKWLTNGLLYAMIQWVEYDHGGKLMFSEHRFQLPHCHCIALSVIECKVANLKRLAFRQRDIMGHTYIKCDASTIKKILDGPCYVGQNVCS
jgi:hypothetical protein